MTDIFRFLAVPLGYAMRWLYMLLQNYGWTIIIFTFIIRVLMFPLSLKSQKSTARTAAYQPMIQEIQKKWANDKNRQNQEMQKFYEENNIKMTGGCAPMLVNMLVLFGIIAVVQMPLSYILRVPPEQINTGVAIVMQYQEELNINKNTTVQQSLLIGAINAEPDVFVEGTEVAYGVNAADDTAGPIILANGSRLYVDEETGEVMLEQGEEKATYTLQDGNLLDAKGNVVYSDVHAERVSMDPEVVSEIADFKFDFAGLNLSKVPSFSDISSLILPILSVLTMIASQILIMLTSGQTTGRNTMWVMTIAMSLFFGWYAFTVPAGFSLYYTASNVVMTLQQLIMKRIYDPAKIREEVEREIEERKAAKKAKKKVAVAVGGGMVETKELSDAEIVQLRLARARELDALQYEDDTGENEALKKAREQDEARYSKKSTAAKKAQGQNSAAKANKLAQNEQAEAADPENAHIAADTANDAPPDDISQGASAETAAAATETAPKQTQPAKPGRRKRARQNKEGAKAVGEEKSFAQKEQEFEQNAEQNG